MFEIFTTITDELGSRVVPTGQGAFLEAVANDIRDEFARAYPEQESWVEFVADSTI